MFSADMMNRMTKEQKHNIAMLGVKARELKRLRDEPPIYLPIPQGLQLAAMFLDLRTPMPIATHILLFDAGYKNRYGYAVNNTMQPGLVGWHDAVRQGANHVRPLINI